MEEISEILKNKNTDCNFSEKINEVKDFSELNNLDIISDNKKYHNFLYCILDNYDLILSNTLKKEKKHILNERVFKILSELEEDKENKYDHFNYSKNFPLNKIQNGFQLCLKNSKLLSCIFYLNDLYKTHFIIADIKNNEYTNTCLKNYPKKYLLCHNDNTFSLDDSIDESFKQSDISKIFENDINKNIYEQYLKPISNYKIDELKKIAIDFDINIYNGSKLRLKKDIYNDINLYKLNLIN
jgi:hypothetical protein